MTTFLSDDFNSSSLSSQWNFIDPLGNSFYNLSGTNTKDAYLELSVPSGSSHDIWNNTVTAARVMQPATNTDFELEVKFASEPAQKYQIQGILVEQNANNWLRFDTFHDGSQLLVFAAATINGSSQEKIIAEIDSGEASHLRVNRQGSTWTLEYSADGQTWASAGSFTQALNVTSVGTFAGNAGNNAPAFTSQVDYFFNTAAPINLEDGNQLSLDNDISVTENDTGTTTLNFTVSLLEASDEVVTVDFSTASATATEGVDYIGSSGTLSFAPGVTEQTISVEVRGDENIEPYESFFVNLFNPSNASIGDGQAIVTITDDDVDPNFPQVQFPDDAGLVNIKDYGAKGDGVTDDTAAIQQALAENRVVYFPNGTYLVSDTLEWGDTKRLVLQGESQDKTIIKLKDNLAAFNNSNSPKPLITTFEGESTGQAFQNSIYNLTVDVGAGNAGAIGIRFTSNNQGGLRDVTIRSSDPNNLGKSGLALTKPWPGPSLFRNVTVEGFNYGVEVNHPEYSNVFENLTLRDQKIAGISNNGNILSIRGLTSNNSVPVIENNDDKGMITLIDGNFEGGSSQTSAINLKAGTLYARNITTEGYQSALKKGNSVVSGNSISEYVSSPAYSLFPSPGTSLQLDVPELPEIRYDNLSNWANVTDFGAIAGDNQDDSAAIQAALNSGKSTVYFPGGRYDINNTLEVGGNVKLITGASYQTVLTVGGNLQNQEQPVFRFESGNQDTVTLERFFGDYGGGNFHWVEQASPNTLVLRNFAVGSGSAYRNSVPGELIIEDVGASDWVFDEQKVWAWQLNPEGFTTKITNNGGQLWVLGLKTEKEGTVIETTAGGQTEVLGGLIYPASRGDLIPSQQPAFINNESQVTIAGLGESRYNVGSYNILVEETRNGVTETLLNDSNILRRGQGFKIPLYTGFDDGTGNVNQAPVAANDTLTIDSVEAIVIDVLNNDRDRDGRLDPTSVTINNQPSQGNVSVDLTTGAITYTPNANFTNNDSFTYTVTDDDGETSNVATVSITLDANQAIVANNDTASVSSGQFVEINVLANDTDSDGTVDPLTVEIAQPPAYGEVLVNSNGTITYTHNGSNTASDSFTYTVRDNDAAQSNVATVNLLIQTPSQNMTTFLSDDFNNSSLKSQWSFVDPLGNSSYSLTGTNTEDAYLNLSVPGGSSHDLWKNNKQAARVMQPATNTDFELEAKFASVPSQKFQMQGILVEQNANNWLRFDTFHDGSQLLVFAAATINGSSQEKIIANINPTLASHLRVNRQGSTWTLQYSADGQTWASAGSFTQALNVTSVGTFAGNAGNNAPAFTSQVDYFFNTAAPIVPEDVALPNQAPVANNDTAMVAPSESVVIKVLDNDTDSDGTLNPATVSLVTPPSSGTAVVNSNGTITYTHTGSGTGSDNFSYRVADNDGELSPAASVAVNIATPPPNQAPVANNDSGNVSVAGSVTLNVLSNDTDSDGTINPASVNIVTQPSSGTAVVNNNGTITYTHTGSSSGSDSFSYRVADDDGALSTAANVSLNVTQQTPGSPQVNIWYGPNQTFGQIGEPQTWINILGNASDPDGLASVTYSLNNGPSRALSLGPDTRRLQNPGDFNVDIAFDDLDGSPADDIVRVTATDTLGNTSTQTITVDYESGNVWPESYSIDWSSVGNLQDVTQVVDGLWTLEGDTVRPVELGYDRLLGIGDVSWDDYEITVPFTLNSLNAAPGADEAGVGVLMRWTGHTDDPIPNAQPKTGFNPYGAIAWYYKGQLEITGNRLASIAEAPFTIEDGVTYNLKARAEGQSYSFKLWEQGQPEPSSWTLQGQGKASDPSKGSILLVAHQYDVSFGDVTITPLGSSSSNNTTPTSGSTTTNPTNPTQSPNQSPVANDDTATAIAGGAKVLNVLSNDSDTDGSLNVSTLAIVNQPSNGSVQVNSNGTITYTNTSGLVGSDSFTYTIKDNQGAISNPATVSLNVVEQALAFNSDDFSQVGLDSQWTFIDPLTNSFYQLTGTGSENAHLELSIPGGTAHDAWNSNNAVRMMQPAVDTDFELEVKFASQPSQGFQFQGILVEQDAKNWLRFDTLHDGSDLRVFAAATINGKSQTKIDTTVNPGSANFLRVNRQGNLWQLEYSADGSSWKTAGSFTQSLTTNSVGTLAGNAGNSPAYTAKVDYFFNTASPIIPEDGASFPYLVASDTQGNTNVVEGGITDSYNLVLSSQPTANVVVDVMPDEQLTTDISTVTFTPSNWNVPQSVTVTAVDDELLEENHTGMISHTVTSADPDYDGLSIPDFDVTVADNDIPIRINVGGENYTDSSGNKWLADYGFVKFDGTFTSPFGVKGTNEFPLFETERYGKAVSYEIPIANGTYDVNLNFIENVYTQAGQRVFDLRIENQLVLDDFDIWDEYRILDRIVPRTFEDVTVTDGVLNLDFLATASNGFTLAIEVLEPGGEVIAQQNGNNTLIGNDDRNDTLISVDTSANYPGQGEVDVITGNGGIDIFVLGDNVKAYYDDGLSNSQGLNDYALITDFSVGQQDIIQLHGNKANYQLAASPSGLPGGTAIFRNVSNSSELIAIVQGVTDLDLASPSFSFV